MAGKRPAGMDREMTNNNNARVMVEWEDRVTVTTDYTEEHAQFLAQLIANAYRPETLASERRVWSVSQAGGKLARVEYTPAEEGTEEETVSATSYIDPDTLALARIVASAEGITVEEALADQVDLAYLAH